MSDTLTTAELLPGETAALATPVTISPIEPRHNGLDFFALKKEGLKFIQARSGDIWTDYNEHDPGVTTLEQCCYALTELCYRAELPLVDLLSVHNNQLDPQQGLYSPQAMMTCNPVTISDYRKLIVDRVPSVANVWLTPIKPGSENVGGCYHISLYVADMASNSTDCGGDPQLSPQRIKDKVRTLYNQHRGLCEDVDQIDILTPVPVTVTADITVNDPQLADTVMAQIRFNLQQLFAPQIKRHSLKTALARGEDVQAIFNGPLLLHGLIDDEQLKPKASCFCGHDIFGCLVNIEGVTSISGITMDTGNEVEKGCYLQLSKVMDQGITIKFRNMKVPINPQVVQRQLNRLEQNQRLSYALEAACSHHFAAPKGQFHELAQYTSIQQHFPDVYGINDFGVASNQPRSRHAQAKQFKGYLLVFDQLLANYFAQLAHAKDLYAIDPALNQSYFYQSLENLVPQVAPLLKTVPPSKSYQTGLADLVRSQDNFKQRRNRFLDVSLALYGQQMSTVYMPPHVGCDNDWRLLQAKLGWLRHQVAGTQGRGRGMNYQGRATSDNIAGMAIKLRIELGMLAYEGRSFAQMCAEAGFEMVELDEQATIGRLSIGYIDDLEGCFDVIETVTLTAKDKTNGLPQYLSRGQTVTLQSLQAFAVPDGFVLGFEHQTGQVTVLCQSPINPVDWHFIERCHDKTTARKVVVQLHHSAKRLNAGWHQLYLVEHLLLRFAEQPADLNYTFTLSVVICASPAQLADPLYIHRVKTQTRQNTPLHIQLNYCFITPRQLAEFQQVYLAWRQSLAKDNSNKRKMCCQALQALIVGYSSELNGTD
jgi:hypothetical protein